MAKWKAIVRMAVAGALLVSMACSSESPLAPEPATPIPELQLRAATSTSQIGFAGGRVNAPGVFVSTASGERVAGVRVSFSLTAGDAVLERNEVLTDQHG